MSNCSRMIHEPRSTRMGSRASTVEVDGSRLVSSDDTDMTFAVAKTFSFSSSSSF
jgi:hypothetical protein